MAVSNSESRKLYLYARNDDFNATVDGVTVLAFVAAANISASEKKVENDKAKATSLKRQQLLKDWPVVYERHSTLRK